MTTIKCPILPADLTANEEGISRIRKLIIKFIRNLQAYDLSKSSTNDIEKQENENRSKGNRKIFVIRHGERVDNVFKHWHSHCFDEFGTYNRKDSNMPMFLPNRHPDLWKLDTPATNVGCYLGVLTGDAMKDVNVTIDSVYCSPSYRCIQTCSSVLEGLGMKAKAKVCIEPGLFEWTNFCAEGLPVWLTPEELLAANFNIDTSYVPKIKRDEILKNHMEESWEEFYNRNHNTLQNILKEKDGNILIVAHGATLDTCSRQLIGLPFRPLSEIKKLLTSTVYCAMIAVEKFGDEWKLVDPPCLPITHGVTSRFNWHELKYCNIPINNDDSKL